MSYYYVVPAWALPSSAIPSNALPASALPASALPASALPASAIPIPASAVPTAVIQASAPAIPEGWIECSGRGDTFEKALTQALEKAAQSSDVDHSVITYVVQWVWGEKSEDRTFIQVDVLARVS